MRRSSTPVAVDLFAGAGGLSLGLQRAGFRVAAAVEARPAAAETFRLNHAGSVVITSDVRRITSAQITDAVGSRIDLLAACPPCQGFTSLTSRWRKEDPRNKLVDEVVRFAAELRPRAVMFENVPRLAESAKGRRRFERLLRHLEALGYVMSWYIAEAADYGTPQYRRRLIVYGASKTLTFPEPTHGPRSTAGKRWRTVRDVIEAQSEPQIFKRREKTTASLRSWHVVRDIGAANIARLRVARPNGNRWELPNELRPPCHRDSSEGFRNVYGRMTWDHPAPTITGGCTSPSKGRFGHPRRLGTISVKEAALLQDFPASYRLATPYIDEACELIGNAFPANLAEVAAEQVLRAL